MIGRVAMLLALGGFVWAARSFQPAVAGGLDAPGLTMSLGFALLAAFVMGQLAVGVGLPRLTGYLATGVVAGPAVLGLLTTDVVEDLGLINGVAVSLIAMTAGGELGFRRMRSVARSIGWITLVAVVGTAALLAAALFLAAPHLPFLAGLAPGPAASAAFVLAVVLVAQSPAVVIAVRAETGSDGPLTRTVLGVVVVADLLVIVLFAIALAVSRAALQGAADVGAAVGSVAWELFGSMGTGLLVGAVLLLYLSKVRGSASLFLVALCVAIAEVGTRLHLDPLITALSAGVLVENASDRGHELLRQLSAASLPLYLVFFTVAGASLHPDSLAAVGLPAAALAGLRATGLLGGTWLAGRLAGAPPEVGRWAGFGLLPQAGLAIALALLIGRTLPELGPDAVTLVLAVVAINEVVAPFFFRRALLRSGEASATQETSPATAH